jgi:biotin carboxyl carrier protein
MSDEKRYQVTIGDNTYDLRLRADHVMIGETEKNLSFEPVDHGSWLLSLDGRSYRIQLEERTNQLSLSVNGQAFDVLVKSELDLLMEKYGMAETIDAAAREVRAPMPGLVLRMMAEPGLRVEAGDGLVVLEAMKMENEIRASRGGTIKAVHASEGTPVSKNALLIEFEA